MASTRKLRPNGSGTAFFGFVKKHSATATQEASAAIMIQNAGFL
jgi:hypothetical protein